MRSCALCKVPAKTFCDSDQAALCWDCDAKVHGANFLVARHSRTLLCHACQCPTPWTASGAKLGHTVSVCDDCVNGVRTGDGAEEGSGGNDDDMPDDGDSDRDDGDDEGDDDDEEVEDGDDGAAEDEDDGGGGSDGGGDEDGDNQVVPWSSTTPPPAASSSSSDESVSRLYLGGKRERGRASSSLKRTRGSPADLPEDLSDSSSRRNRGSGSAPSKAREATSTGRPMTRRVRQLLNPLHRRHYD